jgi:hypothetical protein
MSRLLWQSLIPAMVGFGLGGSMFAPSQAQVFLPESQADTIIIGNSPEEWSYYSGYWQQLMDLRPKPVDPISEKVDSQESLNPQTDPAYLLALSKKVVVNNLRQEKISRRFGTSQIVGTLTNHNKEPVVIQGVNFEIRSSTGELLQTGTAVPQPKVLAPGQTVTFSQTLLSIPINRRFQLKLLDPAVALQPQTPLGEVAFQ